MMAKCNDTPITIFATFLRVLLLAGLTAAMTPMWCHAGTNDVSVNADGGTLNARSICSKLIGLSPGQRTMCGLFFGHMSFVGEGARKSIKECQHQFHDRRWNCSTPAGSGYFGPLHNRGTREAAFTYALISAGVTHELGRSCRLGLLDACGCSAARRPTTLNNDWQWGGCGDNFQYGYEFARNFIDVREKEHNHRRRSARYARSLVNRWNNEVGRKILKRKTFTQCKCHGVSGSCNMKTCWQQLPDVRRIGDVLLQKYKRAVRVRVSLRGNLQRMQQPSSPTAVIGGNVRRRRRKGQTVAATGGGGRFRELVFLDESPDYCKNDTGQGTLGTSGRTCQVDSANMDRCELLCCGRGYHTFRKTIHKKCDCKFQWCCKVVCQTCVEKQTIHVCK